MVIRKLGRNDKCHCGSGKKYKHCHLGQDALTPVVFEGDEGFSATLHPDKMTARLVEEVDPEVPEWLFLHAASFARQATTDGTHSATMMTVLLTAAASEALVNRLLGPHVGTAEWPDIEMEPPVEKWELLAAKLDLSNELARGRKPLQDLWAVHRLRNELSHFKHERHAVTVTRELPKEIKNGRLVFDAANPGAPLEKRGAGPDLNTALAAVKAHSYFEALVRVLESVLVVYKEDRFDIVHRLQRMIEQARVMG
jgi:SEC-C motif-containing protein